MKRQSALCLLLLPVLVFGANAAGPAVSFRGLLREMVDRDARARWPQPYYRCGQASSWDRSQQLGNPDAWFANNDHTRNVLRVETHGGRREWVLFDDPGPGCITHIWIPLNRKKAGQVVRFYLDGADTPVIEAKWNDLVSGHGRVKPPFAFVAAGADDAQDAGDLYLPIPYARSCRITLDSAPFYYSINNRSYDADIRVESFSWAGLDAAVPSLGRVAAALQEPSPAISGQPVSQRKTVAPDGEVTLTLPGGPGAVRALGLKLPASVTPQQLRATVLTMTFDGEKTVWCPVSEFFGCGPRLRPVADLDRSVTADGVLSCRWVMPYRESASAAILNLSAAPLDLSVKATVGDWHWDERSMYFHADWRRDYPIPTKPRRDWNYLTATGRGVYVGDTLTVFSHDGAWYGEGDERIYIDGEIFPSHLGTGTEDYYGYAWGMTTAFSSAFLSMPRRDHAGGDWRGYTTTSRVRGLDSIPFRRSLRVDMEIWHWADTRVDYAAGTFWYARPGAAGTAPPDLEQATAPMPELPRPFAVSGALEGEKLRILSKSEGIKAGPQPLEQHGPERFSGGSHLFVQADHVGDFVEVALPCRPGQSQRLVVYALKSWDYGIIRFLVNGKALPGTHDFYSPTVEATGPIDLGIVASPEPTLRLRAEVVGRNPAARPPGTYFGIDCVVLKPATETP